LHYRRPTINEHFGEFSPPQKEREVFERGATLLEMVAKTFINRDNAKGAFGRKTSSEGGKDFLLFCPSDQKTPHAQSGGVGKIPLKGVKKDL